MRSFILITLSLAGALALPALHEEVAEVTLVSHFNKRSADAPSDQFHVKVKAFQKEYDLKLKKPEYNILSTGFNILLADAKDGKLTYVPARQNKMADLGEIYIDPISKAAVKLYHIDGQLTIKGLVDDIAISNAGEFHYAKKSKTDELEALKTKDYLEINKADLIDAQMEPESNSTRQTVSAVDVELLINLDMKKYRSFANTNDLIDYLKIFFHAVNNRYETFSTPKIRFLISSVIAATSTSGQPFMENSKHSNGKYDMEKVLPSYSRHIKENEASLPKHDLAHLFTGEDMVDSGGSTGIAGLAYVGAACMFNGGSQSYATAVSEDIGAHYDGTFTVAHELAHNMGSNHDGDGTSRDCPWSDGYIMSYEGWGTKNKFYFSSCTIREMNKFIQSSGSACLRRRDGGTPWGPDSRNPGDMMNRDEQCKKRQGRENAYADNRPSPNEQCRKLCCRWQEGNSIWTSCGSPPGDNSPCGTGSGRCKDGDCV